MNDLEKYFYYNDKRMIHKFHHYFEIYERHFSKYRGKQVNILEIGIGSGGSLQMWKEYFGPLCNIYGVDKEDCAHMAADRIHIFQGDQGDRDFLKGLAMAIPHIDILIDDGSHKSPDQIATFEELFPYVAEDGVYLCEDLQMAYHIHFGGGYKQPTSFLERMKDCVDYIHNQVFPGDPSYAVNLFEKIEGLHVYHQMVVIEKRNMHRRICSSIMTGKGYTWISPEKMF